nr:reverse transcriptase domain-containing protein [Tanacetum cinerariifolium]
MFLIEQVPRNENKKADALSKIASTSFAHLTKQFLVEILKKKSIKEQEILVVSRRKRILLDDTTHRVPFGRYPTGRHKKGPGSQDQSKSIYYDQWRLVQKVIPRTIVAVRQSNSSRICGLFPEAQGNLKFLIVAINYFTKWVEAKLVATITGNQVKKFVWDNILCRFGLPGEITSKNGKQFRNNPFKDWCEKLNIKQRFTSVKHTQSNDQVEKVNRSIGEGIKGRLGENNRNWVEEVPHVLWAHRMMIKTSNGDTVFSLTYGTEVLMQIEIGMPSLRCTEVNQAKNDEELLLNLDILEERREKAAVRKAKSKAKMEKYYNARVRSTAFRSGDFVYRSNEVSNAKNSEKLGPK